MALISTCGLVWCRSFVWVVCPQALVVMFLRQATSAFDSLGLPDLPELATAILYYPIIGWKLSKAAKQGKIIRVSIRVVIWHAIALALALAACALRNSRWGR